MPQKRHLAEEIVAKLRQADVGIVRMPDTREPSPP
jgi:hypothetical protein